VHSQGELGISVAAQLHLAAVLPSLTHAPDAHYHHLVDDVIEGGKMRIESGGIRVPSGPGLGIKLDRARLDRYHELGRKWQASAETSMVGDSRAAAHLAVLPKW
jgi:glucarate dehydratase